LFLFFHGTKVAKKEFATGKGIVTKHFLDLFEHINPNI
jgi:hypothetical protein